MFFVILGGELFPMAAPGEWRLLQTLGDKNMNELVDGVLPTPPRFICGPAFAKRMCISKGGD